MVFSKQFPSLETWKINSEVYYWCSKEKVEKDAILKGLLMQESPPCAQIYVTKTQEKIVVKVDSLSQKVTYLFASLY